MTTLSNQKADIIHCFGEKWKNVGNLDYVSCWYKKAADFIQNTLIKAAFVSTNSITQGEQVPILWKPLFQEGIYINFAYRTFKWKSESTNPAQVFCVIIGFNCEQNKNCKGLFSEKGMQLVDNINFYLNAAPNVFIESRQKPLCPVPETGIGNKPIDDGNYLFSKEEMIEFLLKEPSAKKYFRPWYGSKEFINQKPRYCLWLGDIQPSELRRMPYCFKRVENVRKFRLKSESKGTRKIANNPTRFHVENMPNSEYIVIPRVSSERRKYIPIGFMTPDCLCSDAVHIIPNATMYHFGILTSSVHMSWMRTVCGRLKSDYRYSKDVVYNNFPWCDPTKEQKAKIEKTAQEILDARALFPDSSLADLYDEMIMPIELRNAHQHNDQAVIEAYGFEKDLPEPEIVAELMKMYQKLTEK